MFFSHVTRWVRPDYDKKNLEKEPRQHFLPILQRKMTKIWGNSLIFDRNCEVIGLKNENFQKSFLAFLLHVPRGN